MNDGQKVIMPNWESCKSFCTSLQAKYFTWIANEAGLSEFKNSCWCKSSNAGRRAKNGFTSGEACSACSECSSKVAGSCYVKDNMDWVGSDTYTQANVVSMEDCQNICRQKEIQHFVWVRRDNRCVCKKEVTRESSSTCCMSGDAFGSTCGGELTTIL